MNAAWSAVFGSPLPTVLVFDGTQKTLQWRVKEPRAVGYRRIKRLTNPFPITFVANVSLVDIEVQEQEQASAKGYIPLLKSNLQKCIRRNMATEACCTVAALTRTRGGTMHLLRRLPVIVVEDKYAHWSKFAADFAWLCFLMATGQGPEGWLGDLLALVNDLCCTGEGVHVDVRTHEQVQKTWYTSQSACSLCLRAYYGGMRGDVRMLFNAARLEKNSARHRAMALPVRTPNHVPTIAPDILLAAVDFHLLPSLCADLARRTGHKAADVKQAIWLHSSALRAGVKPPPEYLDVFRAIRSHLGQAQRAHLDRVAPPLQAPTKNILLL
jgi:hypothetical protein